MDYFTADVVSYSDYLCFGQLAPNRHGSEGSYRYGFNGKEKLDELHDNSGDSYDFGARILDVRLGRWLSCDPLESHYPQLSPYNFVNNNPLLYVDDDGRIIKLHYKENGKDKYLIYEPGVKPSTNNKAVQQFHEAVTTIMKNDADNTFQKIHEESQIVVFNIGNHINEDETKSEIYKNKTFIKINVFWNPNLGLVLTNDGELTPATALLHEAAHALRRLQTNSKKEFDKFIEDKKDNGTDYDNNEEKRVIDKVETPYVKKTNKTSKEKQGTRKDHRGFTIKTKGPNSQSSKAVTIKIKKIKKSTKINSN